MIKRKLLYGLVVSYCCLLGTLAHAQQITPTRDFGTWIGIQLEQELPKGFAWGIESQLRTWYNSTKIDQAFAELGLGYTINKNFKLQGNFRYLYELNKWEEAQNSWRYNLDLQVRLPLPKKWKLSYRARYQQKFVDGLTHKRTTINKVNTTVRHQLKVQWKCHKKHQLYYLTELFIHSNVLTTAHLHQLRLGLGDKIKTKVGKFNLGVGYEVNLQPEDTFSFFFTKLIYKIEL